MSGLLVNWTDTLRKRFTTCRHFELVIILQQTQPNETQPYDAPFDATMEHDLSMSKILTHPTLCNKTKNKMLETLKKAGWIGAWTCPLPPILFSQCTQHFLTPFVCSLSQVVFNIMQCGENTLLHLALRYSVLNILFIV